MFGPLRRLSMRKSKKLDDSPSVTTASTTTATATAPTAAADSPAPGATMTTKTTAPSALAAAESTAKTATDAAAAATAAAATAAVQARDRATSLTTTATASATAAAKAVGPASSTMLEALSALTFGPRNAFPLYVPVADLHNATDNGLNKLKSRTLGRLRRRVYVEAAANSRSDNIFFVPLPDLLSPHTDDVAAAGMPAPVGFAAVPPAADTSHLVLASDDFEVALVGMHTVPQDAGFNSGSELLLYSVRDLECAKTRRADHPERARELGALRTAGDGSSPTSPTSPTSPASPVAPNGDGEKRRASDEPARPDIALDARRRHDLGYGRHSSSQYSRRNRRDHSFGVGGSGSGDDSGSEVRKEAKTHAHLNPGDDAKIHYDPVIDGHDQGNAANTYISVPGRKGLLLQHHGAVDSHVDTVEARFTVVEVDAVTPAQRRGVQKAGEVLTGTVGAVPFGKFVSPALGGFSSLANSALDRFEVPDHVISRDVMFRLLHELPGAEVKPPVAGGHEKRRPIYADNYLRYGYYFFLAQKVDAKLYAQNDTSSQTVPLMLRRLGRRTKGSRMGEREFFPLTGVSYVVMKVTPGCLSGRTDRTGKQRVRDRERLEEILNMKKAMDLLRNHV